MTDYKTGCKDCCTDVDECANGTHHCSDICENSATRIDIPYRMCPVQIELVFWRREATRTHLTWAAYSPPGG